MLWIGGCNLTISSGLYGMLRYFVLEDTRYGKLASFRHVRQIIETFQTVVHFRWVRDLRCERAVSLHQCSAWTGVGSQRMPSWGERRQRKEWKNTFSPFSSCRSDVIGNIKCQVKHDICFMIWLNGKSVKLTHAVMFLTAASFTSSSSQSLGTLH